MTCSTVNPRATAPINSILRSGLLLSVLSAVISVHAEEGAFYNAVQPGGNIIAMPDKLSTAMAAKKVALQPANFIWLESLDLSKGRFTLRPFAVGNSAIGKPITMGGKVYAHGVGSYSRSVLTVDLKGVATQFLATVGIDDSHPYSGSVTFEIWLDGRKVADSGLIESLQPVKVFSVDLTGGHQMLLRVENGGDFSNNDCGNWADAKIVISPGAREKPQTVDAPSLGLEPKAMVGLELEPLPAIAPVDNSSVPAIHGPRITGATPGHPFLYLIPATGAGPLKYSAEDLPAGLKLDEQTGIISGVLEKDGRWVAQLKASGPQGVARRKLVIVGDRHKLALTPPMGWNSWYVWGGDRVTEQKIREAADWMVKQGLAVRGYQYVNIDDGWDCPPGRREKDGHISTGELFQLKTSMKALGDYIHAKGLKFGIYSSPGPTTCGNYEGSYQHELQDARTWAEWGVDFFKSDLCGYLSVDSGSTVEARKKAVTVFREAIDQCGRDMVYTFGGWGDTWEWGREVGLNCWRIAGDINPKWSDVRRVALCQRGTEQQAGPGHWNDPDFLQVGPSWFSQDMPTFLTGNEQLFHMTHWCMSAAPLILSCNLAKLEPFTLALISNDEVIEVDQDPLGIQGRPVTLLGDLEVMSRPLFDGTQAVALFNWGEKPAQIEVRWADLRLAGPHPVRDLWLRKDLGVFDGSFKATVARHGTVMLKVGKPGESEFAP
ncbi:MAG: NPCBM/NEW2 domain-containing protein [Verrucomicrobia bacterium]|nr:NPCBM/NEW2 domain-containing protein [Verrucomicrobiota bacterium]